MKADEEFAIEKVCTSSHLQQECLANLHLPKAKLVKQEQQAIDAQYEKKRKGSEVAQKMSVCCFVH